MDWFTEEKTPCSESFSNKLSALLSFPVSIVRSPSEGTRFRRARNSRDTQAVVRWPKWTGPGAAPDHLLENCPDGHIWWVVLGDSGADPNWGKNAPKGPSSSEVIPQESGLQTLPSMEVASHHLDGRFQVGSKPGAERVLIPDHSFWEHFFLSFSWSGPSQSVWPWPRPTLQFCILQSYIRSSGTIKMCKTIWGRFHTLLPFTRSSFTCSRGSLTVSIPKHWRPWGNQIL